MEKALQSCFEKNLGLDGEMDERFLRVLEDGSQLKYYDSHADEDGQLHNGVYLRPDGGYLIRSHGCYRLMELVAQDIRCDTLAEVFAELIQRSYFQCGEINDVHLRLEQMLDLTTFSCSYPTPKHDILHLLKKISARPELVERVANLRI